MNESSGFLRKIGFFILGVHVGSIWGENKKMPPHIQERRPDEADSPVAKSPGGCAIVRKFFAVCVLEIRPQPKIQNYPPEH